MGALVVYPGLDEVGGEDSALEEEVVVGFEGGEGLIEGAWGGADAGFGGRVQLVDVFIEGFGRLDFVDDAVQAGHEEGGEGEVGVAGGVGGSELEALGFRVGG